MGGGREGRTHNLGHHTGRTMIEAKHSVIVVCIAAALGACEAEDYPPCSPGDEGVGGGGPGDVQAAVGVAASTGAYGARSDGDEYGYSRNESGEVCACDARETEYLGCVPEPPPPLPSGDYPVCGSDEDPGYGLCDWNNGTLPETPTICGNVYWCCFSIRCEDGHKLDTYDHHIYAKLYGQDNTREGAWRAWQPYIKAGLKESKQEHGVCWIREASCYDEPTNKLCGNYPN
jgi:hypothetical protein